MEANPNRPRERTRRPALLGVALVLLAFLLLVQMCQRNRIADNDERLARRLEELSERLDRFERDGTRAPAAAPDSAPPPPRNGGAAANRLDDPALAPALERLRRDRSVDLLAGAFPGSLLPKDHPAFNGQGDGRGDGRIPPLEAGTRGGTLRVPLRGDVDGFNPVTSKSLASFGLLFQVFDPLFFVDPWNLELLPRLAVGYDVSDDLLDWTIHLRPGVTWADGVPFTADDVVFTFDLMTRPDVVSYSSREYDYDVAGARVPVTWKRIDDRTVRFHQPLPYPAFPNKLAFRLIVPAHVLRDVVANGSFQQHWGVGTSDFSAHVGTGPFRIASYETGTRVTLARNPAYWGRDRGGQPLPYLDRIVFELLEGPDVPFLRFKAGDVDLLGDVPADLVPLVRDLQSAGRARLFDVGADIGWVYVVLNENSGASPATGRPCVEPRKLAWFRDRRFRQAVSLALDRDAIVETVYQSLALPGAAVYNASCGVFHDPKLDAAGRHDAAAAARLLDELGLVDRDGDGIRDDASGRPVEFALSYYERTPDLTPVASMVADQLRAAGIRVRLDRCESSRFSSLLFERFDYEAVLGEDSSGIALPCGDHPMFSSPTEYHVWYPRQPQPSTPWEAEIDRLFRAASLEREPRRVVALLDRFQEVMAEEQPILFLASMVRSMACRPDLANFRPAPLEPAVFWNAAEMFFRR